MKITMYELLGMVKDGKAPKKVKYKNKIYYYHEGYDFNYMYNSSDYSLMTGDKSLFTFDSFKMKDGRCCWDNNTAIDFLNDEVEILEEEKEEEKKILEKLNKLLYREEYATQNACIDDIIRQFNHLIDYLKSKGE